MKRLIIALLVAMVLLEGGVVNAANTYPEAKCGDPVDKDDSLLAEQADWWLGKWVGDADEPRDFDGVGQWSCINEKK